MPPTEVAFLYPEGLTPCQAQTAVMSMQGREKISDVLYQDLTSKQSRMGRRPVYDLLKTGEEVTMAMETGTLQLTTTGYRGQPVLYEVSFMAFPTVSGRLIIQAPGTGEPKEGAGNRFVRLAECLQSRSIATFVTFNPPTPDGQFDHPDEPYSYRGASWNRIYVEGMAYLVEHCLNNAEALCGAKEPEVCLAGFSSGGSVVVTVSPFFAAVKKILLVSTYDSVSVGSMGWYYLSGLRRYTGEIYVTYGEEDAPAGMLAMTVPAMARSASAVHARAVPHCGHSFAGETNGRILSKAYLWAFAGDDSFPSPDGGVPLYE